MEKNTKTKGLGVSEKLSVALKLVLFPTSFAFQTNSGF